MSTRWAKESLRVLLWVDLGIELPDWHISLFDNFIQICIIVGLSGAVALRSLTRWPK